jgi:hypothetical protein
MQTLAVAIERKQWELAALCLLLGLTEAAAKLPPEAIEGLLEVLATEDGPPRPKARSRRGRAH